MQAAAVLVAGLRIARSESEVDRAADFFVEQCILRVPRHIVVGADGAFAEVTRAGVHRDHRAQKVLSFLSFSLRDFATLERQSCVMDFASAMYRRKAEFNMTFNAGLSRSREHFAVGEIVV